MLILRNFSNVLAIISFFILGGYSKLNVPRILLPIFRSVQPSFLLEDMDAGCFFWSTTRDDLISLTPVNVDGGCSPKVLVSTCDKPLVKGKAVVIGIGSQGETVKCDVLLQTVEILQLLSTTRELFIDDTPGRFTVIALDEEGNEFSTLDKVEFIWQWHSTPLPVVKFLTHENSPYEAPRYVLDLERENRTGNMILLQGIATGMVTITVRLPHQEYRNIPEVEISATVSVNIVLVPSEVYLIPGDVIEIVPYIMVNNVLNRIDLKEYHYYLKAADSNFINVDTKSNEATALKVGKTEISIASTREDISKTKMPSVFVIIAQPSYMALNIKPHGNWIVLVGDPYEITVEIYTQGDQLMNMGRFIDVKVQINDSFHIDQRSQNGTWLIGWGIRESKATIQATFDAVNHQYLGKFPLDHSLAAQETLYIYPEIIVKPTELILPWDPYYKPKFTVNLTAIGGDRRFLWSTTDSSIGYVTQFGQVRTIGNGTFEVSAAMERNHHNRQHSKIAILQPVRLEISEYMIEAAVGDPIFLHIAMYALYPQSVDTENPIYIPITLCDSLPLQIKLSDSNFRVNHSAAIPLIGISCANIPVIGDEVGTCKVTITMELSGNIMEDSVTITSYNPLVQIQPEGEVVLAVGASILLFFEGGPIPLLDLATTYQRVVVVDGFEEIVESTDVTKLYGVEEEQIVVHVRCRKLGEALVHVLVSNTPTLKNCKANPSDITTKIICGKPRKIKMNPNIILPGGCPMKLDNNTVIIPVDQQVVFNVTIFDEIGRLFKNCSTLVVKWTAVPYNKIEFLKQNGLHSSHLIISDVVIANGSAQIIQAIDDNGLVTISAHVVNYNQVMLDMYGIESEKPAFITPGDKEMPEIKASIKLLLMNSTQPAVSTISVFNQPGLKRNVEIFGGSGYLQLILSEQDIAEIGYNLETRLIEITPLRSGEVTIEIQDMCMVSEITSVVVKVIAVGRITLEMPGKVEINRCIEVVINLYDELDQPVEIEDPKVIKVIYRLSKHIAYIALAPLSPTEPWGPGEIHYTLTGMELGFTEIVFAFEVKGWEVTSNSRRLQVFKPLQIYPRNITMLVGSYQQLSINGGPFPDCNIDFNSVDSSVVDIDINGVIKGVTLGHTLIIAKSISIDAKSDSKVVYAQDAIDVNIIKIEGVKIAAPITLFQMHSIIPVWVIGIPSQISPVVLGSFDSEVALFEWALEDNNVATITDVITPLGIAYPSSDRVTIRLIAQGLGRTKLTVNVSLPGAAAGESKLVVQFFADAIFEVKEAFQLSYPYGIAVNWILMAPYSEMKIKTNYDGRPNRTISYSLPTEVLCEKSYESCATDAFTNILKLTSDGVIKSTGKIGFGLLTITITRQSGARRTLSYGVQVKPISYAMISVSSTWRTQLDSHLHALPVGIEFILKARFFDNIGRRFNAVPVEAKLRGNRQDLLKLRFLRSNTYGAVIQKAGITTIKIWSDGEHHTADYIRVHSADIIKPAVDSMVSGDILCLWSPIISRDFAMAKWSTSDENLVYIDEELDVAYAIGAKEGTVYLTNPLHPSVPIVLHILPPVNITIIQNPNLVITNGAVGTAYRVELVIKSMKSLPEKDKNLIQGWKCDLNLAKTIVKMPYICFLEFTRNLSFNASELFKVKPGFTIHDGRYNCKITVNDVRNALEMSTIETKLALWVISSENQISSERVNLTFLPQFYAEQEIVIESGLTTGVLDIYGLNRVLKQLLVDPADPSIIQIDKGTFVTPTLLRYQVSVIDYHWKLANLTMAMAIGITSKITSQSHTIMVILDDKNLIKQPCVSIHQSTLARFLRTYRHSMFVLVTVCAILIIPCLVYSKWSERRIRHNVRNRRLRIQEQNRKYGNTSQQNPNEQDPRSRPTTCTWGNLGDCGSEEIIYSPEDMYPCGQQILRCRRRQN